MKRRLRTTLFVVCMMLMCTAVVRTGGTAGLQTVEAHSGRTDASGGHHDYKNASGLGSYHYHCGGHSAHLHPGGVCPFAGSADGGKSSVSSPRISKKSAKLYAGAGLKLKISGVSGKVQWSSSKKSVATVNSKGKVTAKKKGTTVITAIAGSRKFTCRLTVRPLALNRKKATVTEGSSVKLKIKGATRKIRWSSSDAQVASVNSKGKVKAKSAGTATITARIGKQKFKCRVTVKKKIIPVEYFYLDESSLRVKEGHTEKIPASVEPSNATDQTITWSSSNPRVASVSQGVVTGISVGTATITASCSGYEDMCSVTVVPDFVEAEAQAALTCTSYRCDDDIIAEVTSHYKYPMALSAKCSFYDETGNLLRVDSDELNCLETEQTLCMDFDIPFTYGDEKAYDSYKLEFTPDLSGYAGAGRAIAHTETHGADRLSVQVSNNSSEYLSLLNVTVVFFKNGEVIEYDEESAYIYSPDTSDFLSFEYPYRDGSVVVPDDYKIFIEAGSYA